MLLTLSSNRQDVYKDKDKDKDVDGKRLGLQAEYTEQMPQQQKL